MAEGFTKLFASITDSTIWAEPNATRIVWITMLAMADKDGYVGASIPGLAGRARVTIEETEIALAAFMSPDPYSRSQEYEGRRVEEAERGWVLLNYDRFRDMRDEEARREYERERKRAQRSASRNVPDTLGQTPNVPQCPAMSAQAEAEADKEGIGQNRSFDLGQPARPKPMFESWWAVYPKKVKKKNAHDIWKRKKLDAIGGLLVTDVQNRLKSDRRWLGGFVPDPTTYLNGERWQDAMEPPRNPGVPVGDGKFKVIS